MKISHQFPGGTVAEGDFRDRLCRMFAAEVEKRSKGSLKFEIYPGSSLMKTNSQFAAMRKGALDLALVPLAYAGGEVPEVNIGLMPGLVTSYDQGYGWKNAEVGKELNRILLEKGIVLISWIWQAGGVASRTKPIIHPEDAKGMKVRGGSREMDLMLKAAGAAVVNVPSNEIYASMQTGAIEAALTSSTSLISFRLEEVSKALTTGRNGAYWFMFEPLMMSKSVFDKLTKEQQAMIMAGRRRPGRRSAAKPRRPMTQPSPPSTPRRAPRWSILIRTSSRNGSPSPAPTCGRITPTRTPTAPSCWRWPRRLCNPRKEDSS